MTSHNKHHVGLHVVLGSYKKRSELYKELNMSGRILSLIVIIYHPKHTFALHFLFLLKKRKCVWVWVINDGIVPTLITMTLRSGVPRGGGRGPWPPGASLGGGAGPACRGEF